MPSKRTQRWLHILWLLATLTDIVASLLPADSIPVRALDELALSDKLEHMVMYAAIAVLPAIYAPRRFVWTASVGAVLLGVALEYAQLFSGWRDFEYGDMIASALGVGVGVAAGLLVRVVLRLIRRHEAPHRLTRDELAAEP
jgi:VanZ family protein